MRKYVGKYWLWVIVPLGMTLCVDSSASARSTERVSVSSDGTEGNHVSRGRNQRWISADGRYVAFLSAASNLVPDDEPYGNDIFVHDRQTGNTIRISKIDSEEGFQVAGKVNYVPSISADGRFVAFGAVTPPIPPRDSNTDIFVHDRDSDQNGLFDEPGFTATRLVSKSSTGERSEYISKYPHISANGRYVAFLSVARNLVPNDTNEFIDTFVHDLHTGSTVRVSVTSDGAEQDGPSVNDFPPSMSADGRFVTFSSGATNLVVGDTNGFYDVFVHDRDVDGNGVYDEPGNILVERVSVSTSGSQGNNQSYESSISDDGNYVAFQSYATTLAPGLPDQQARIFLRDRFSGTTSVVSVSNNGDPANWNCHGPSITPDGTNITFASRADNLIPYDTRNTYDIFVHNRLTGTTGRVSVSSRNLPGNEHAGLSGIPTISPDGVFVAFEAGSSNLVPDDTNGYQDVFVRAKDLGTDADADGFPVLEDCDDYDNRFHPAAWETKHDGLDQDCNSYDLTIDIVNIQYHAGKDSLKVEATSGLEGAADLKLLGYGPMTWNSRKRKWSITLRPAGGDPGFVWVVGTEGAVSSLTDPEACVPAYGFDYFGNGIDDDCDGPIDGSDPDLGGCSPTEYPELSCSDGIDNDCDGASDDGDPDCAPCWPVAEDCSDGVDNDCDGFTDCDDTDCTSSCGTGTAEGKGKTCSDGIDNDGDGLTDCADPDCSKNKDCR